MRRAPIPTAALLAAAGLVLCAGTAAAQSPGAPAGEARGLRYLSWSGRTEVAPATPASLSAAPGRPDLRRPNPVIPHGGTTAPPTRPGLTPAPGARRTLTPANAWLQPVAPQPQPVVPTPVAPTSPPAPQPDTRPDYLPDPAGRGQAVPAGIVAAPARTEPFDPMAPRPDAPIFRMQQDPPATATQPGSPAAQPASVAEAAAGGERPAQQGGRYYSVHRQNGRQPDGLEMPEPTYVDALAVTMPETIASQDLAEPQQGPTLIRDAQGRMRPAPAASDGDHQ